MADKVVLCGDNKERLKDIPDNSIDSCVTDPPYGLRFMNKKWDYDIPSVELWKEVYRVLKPGAHILVACGTRTQHRMAVNIEDAGFEIRDVISWIYGSGFPKSLDVSKAIDRQAEVEREVIGKKVNYHSEGKRSGTGISMHGVIDGSFSNPEDAENITTPSTDEAKQWNGWGTALKPSTEFWTLARKPLSEDTVAENVLKYGTGGINIDGTRIGDRGEEQFTGAKNGTINAYGDYFYKKSEIPLPSGRFPANLILDEFMGSELDKQTGILTSGHMNTVSQGKNYGIYGKYNGKEVYAEGDSGGASRFFYCAKSSKSERNKGLEKFYWKRDSSVEYGFVRIDKQEYDNLSEGERAVGNIHPTVKPVSLMKYLIKLITPEGGTVLDMHAGSGTTGVAAELLSFNYILIDKYQENCEISEARIAAVRKKVEQKDLFD